MHHTAQAFQPLLIELLTEELPPKALHDLGQAFAKGIHSTLTQHDLLTESCTVTDYATPRRLAVKLSAVLLQAPDREYTEKLMPAKIGLSPDGHITPALAKRLESKGLQHITATDLIIESDGKQDYLFAKGTVTGTMLKDGLQAALDYALTHLPIPKVMRYQMTDGSSVRFVRPAHSLIALWGDQVVDVQALGLSAGRSTQGHRFMGQTDIVIPDADQYEHQLHDSGKVIASFTRRRDLIARQLQAQAEALDSTIGDDSDVQDLLNEVTALVEHPTVYVGEFEEKFLRIPPECLILTMRLNQKYFPLFNPQTLALTHRFLIVSNMDVADPIHIIEGNQRVVRPRLADAQFFFDTDRKTPLAERVGKLEHSVYHNKLGSQLERMKRVRAISAYLARQLNADVALSQRAAYLAKADLGSSMVAEFPELQGIMGAYYAQYDGEDEAVVHAIRNQYRLRVDRPVDKIDLVSTILFIADRVETLVGIWGIGLPPTGERDPFGLRRAALGILSAYEQLTAGEHLTVANRDQLDLHALLDFVAEQFPTDTLNEDTTTEVARYIYERYRNQLVQHHDRQVVDAVLSLMPPVHQVHARIDACVSFATQPEANSLASANKRIANILRKADITASPVDTDLLQEPAEQELAQQIHRLRPQAAQQLEKGDFAGCLATLSKSSNAVDDFFDNVMIMADDPAVRTNRLALLDDLYGLMNQVADISRLAP